VLVTHGKRFTQLSLRRFDMSQTLGMYFAYICQFGGATGPS
jgi:hypothetical protein